MRLLIVLPDPEAACAVRDEMESDCWEVTIAQSGCDALAELTNGRFDVLLLHLCLPGMDGRVLGEALTDLALVCPPRILYICPPECCPTRPAWADGVAPIGVSADKLCALLHIIAKKPLPKLAAAQSRSIAQRVERFLDEIALGKRYKGRSYAAWLLERMIPSPLTDAQPLGALYSACAAAFSASPAAVERCLRVSVESVFMQGNMRGIERYFGATVDPEKGKPTNRAFLLQSAQQLRLELGHSLAEARSPNSRVMHHSPAAPTSV